MRLANVELRIEAILSPKRVDGDQVSEKGQFRRQALLDAIDRFGFLVDVAIDAGSRAIDVGGVRSDFRAFFARQLPHEDA